MLLGDNSISYYFHNPRIQKVGGGGRGGGGGPVVRTLIMYVELLKIVRESKIFHRGTFYQDKQHQPLFKIMFRNLSQFDIKLVSF